MAMPKYMDVHRNLKGTTLEDVAKAHEKDLQVQNEFGVKFLKFWVDEKEGAIFCLSEAPDRDAPTKAHRASHGLLPSETYEVKEGE